MRRQLLWGLVAFAAFAAVGLALKYCPRTVPTEECSAVYRQYAEAPGVRATFVKDKRIDATLHVDVTLLEATDSAGWARLRRAFYVLPPDAARRRQLEAGQDYLLTRSAFDFNALHADSTVAGYELVTVSYLAQSVSIFHTATAEEQRRVMHHNVERLLATAPTCREDAGPLCHTVWTHHFADSVTLPEVDTVLYFNTTYTIVFSGDSSGIYIVNDEESESQYTYMFTYALEPDGKCMLNILLPEDLREGPIAHTSYSLQYDSTEQTLVSNEIRSAWEEKYGKMIFYKQAR